MDKLAGKIVIFDDIVKINKPSSDIVKRLDDEELAALEEDMNTPPQLLRWIDQWLFPQVLNEKAIAEAERILEEKPELCTW